MYRYFHIRDKDGTAYRVEVNEELGKLEIYAEKKVPHGQVSNVFCGVSKHVVHIDENGIAVFNLPLKF